MATLRLRCLSDWDGEQYDACCEQLAAAFAGREVCPFLGAGISIASPANLPPTRPLQEGLIGIFDHAIKIGVQLTGLSYETAKPVFAAIRAARLERLLDALHQTHGRAALDYVSCLNGTQWNANHAALAALSAARSLPVCVTLNFDLLIEYAIARRMRACKTICPLIGKHFISGIGEIATRLIKPHGSFTPAHVGPDAYEHLSATLSHVGSRPSMRNEHALSEAIGTSACVLVAGYSDDDWDVFPILQRLASHSVFVLWVDHVDTKEEAEQRRHPVSAVSTDDSLHRRVRPWLESIAPRSLLLHGRVDELLRRVIKHNRLTLALPGSEHHPSSIDPTSFALSSALTDEQSVRTLIALAHLVRHITPYGPALLRRLRCMPSVANSLDFSSHVHLHLAHAEHTAGQVSLAVRHMRRRIRQRRMLAFDTKSDELWLGYEYLCLAKRPDPSKVGRQPSATSLLLWALSIPLNLLRGATFMHRATRNRRDPACIMLKAQSLFYWADLLHSWGSLLMLGGTQWAGVARWYFGWVQSRYAAVARFVPDGAELMAGDYYWMRELEAQLLAGRRVDRRLACQKLDEIDHRNRLVQDEVQAGNTHAYRALIAYVCHGDTAGAKSHLNCAEKAWAQAGNTMASGRRRIALFRRFIGSCSESDANCFKQDSDEA